jgi:type IV secretory pathway TraG/TraD family ATPase VirD4
LVFSAFVSRGAPVLATKILWGQIIIVFLIVLVMMWAATQWTAWRLGFQPELGQPWFELIGGFPVYLPPAFFWWWFEFGAYAPKIFVQGGYIAASGGLIAATVAIGMSVRRSQTPQHPRRGRYIDRQDNAHQRAAGRGGHPRG